MVLLNLKLTPKKNTYDILRKRKLCLNGVNSARSAKMICMKKIQKEKGIIRATRASYHDEGFRDAILKFSVKSLR